MTIQNTKEAGSVALGVIIVIILIVVITIFVMSDYSNNVSTRQSQGLDDIGAYIEAKDYIEQVLKSPASAIFPPLGLVRRLDNNRYEVISYVDSQNSFGAMLRTNWSVIFQFQNEKKYLEKITIDGEVVYQSKEIKKPVVPSKSISTKVQTTPPPVSKVIPTEQPKLNPTSDKVVLFGERVKLSDKIITVYSVGEYVAKYSTPRGGYRFIYIDAEIENLTDEDLICMLFDLTDDKGKEYERGYPALRDDPEECHIISPYKKGRGFSIFEVPRTREYFQVKYANVLGDIKIDPLHITFKPNSGWTLEPRVQN
jgi:hypothetical protein